MNQVHVTYSDIVTVCGILCNHFRDSHYEPLSVPPRTRGTADELDTGGSDLVIACGLMCSVYPIFRGCLSSLSYSCLGEVACILRLRSIGECIVMKKGGNATLHIHIFTHLWGYTM